VYVRANQPGASLALAALLGLREALLAHFAQGFIEITISGLQGLFGIGYTDAGQLAKAFDFLD
jgi:hypothetical protein